MRPAILCSLLILSACDWFSPPCTRLAKAVCDVGSEGDVCAALVKVERGDDASQALCKQVLPAGQALAKDTQSADAQAAWREARAVLASAGLVVNPIKLRIENKLKEANGLAGKLVEQAEKNSAEAAQKTAEGAERAFDAVNK